MKYIFTFFLVFNVLLFARDNPFEPTNTSAKNEQATYKKDLRKSFTSVNVELPSSMRILKSIEFHYQNLDGSINSKNITIDKKLDWHDKLIVKKLNNEMPNIKKPTNAKKGNTTNINFKNIIYFTVDGKSLHVKTNDAKIRDFLITKPYKIVLDLKKEVSFYTKKYNLKTKYYKSITLGKHDGYYRVAIELDGKYLYSVQNTKDGYLFKLK